MRAFRTPARAIAAAALATAVAGVATASAGVDRIGTTEPTNFAIFTVRLGPTGVAFTPKPSTTQNTTGEFKIYNASGTRRKFALAGRATKLIKSRANTIFFLLFDKTGTFTWTATGPKAKAFKGTFEVTPDPHG
jgi:hypothetical protein